MADRADRTGVTTKRDAAITLSALKTFVAVVDTGSFSEAARQLGVTQPSVSIQLGGLEEACGVLLLHRRPRPQVTEAGCNLYVKARMILSRLDEFEASVRGLRDLKRGRLVVGLSTPHYAIPLIATFLDRNPDIDLQTSTGNTTSLLADVTRCRIDVAIMTLEKPDPQLACTRIASPRLFACVPASHAWSGRRSVRGRDFADVPLIMREPGSLTQIAFERVLRSAGIDPKPRLVLSGREAMKEAVALGLGVGAVYEGELGADTRISGVPVADDLGRGLFEVYAVALKESLELPAVRAFFALAEARALEPVQL
jgi:DNA-binding transcriptional LysR family regulator